METVVIATTKEWNVTNYFKLKEKYIYQYDFILIENKTSLTLQYISSLSPKYIFFPHWSWIIPQEIYKNFECIVFHMTDLPYGRGGSPMQNLIIRDIKHTKISAIKVNQGIDTGDIYIKQDLDISKGSAYDLFIQISKIIFEKTIPAILKDTLIPTKQVGKITTFSRRTPEQSNISKFEAQNIQQLYNFIRMLDAPEYPKAYVEIADFKIEFKQADLNNGILQGKFEVKKNV